MRLTDYKFIGIENLPLLSAISSKNDGNMSFRWGKKADVLAARKKFFKKNGIPLNKVVTILTTDSKRIVEVNNENAGRGMIDISTAIDADGLITREKNMYLFLVVADCSATIFYDPVKEVLALVHLNGKNPELIKVTLDRFTKDFSSSIDDIVVSISPSIQKESFIVPDPFQKKSKEWAEYVREVEDGRTSIDMTGFLIDRMKSYGVKQIFMNKTDTYLESNLFSHRRSVVTGETEGRFAVLVGMR